MMAGVGNDVHLPLTVACLAQALHGFLPAFGIHPILVTVCRPHISISSFDAFFQNEHSQTKVTGILKA